MRICVRGDRNWSDFDRVRQVFNRVEEFAILSGSSVSSIELIHGDCRGLDKIRATADMIRASVKRDVAVVKGS